MNSQNAEIEFCDRIETCDLCIVGAGIAGLNALYVASKYLSKKDKVILLDKNPTVGGMWNETYDYVRLHQPHAMFTAGDIKWTINREPSYLASKDEVLAHFAHCVEYLRTRVTLIERYGWLYEQHTEVPTEGGYEAHIVCRLAASDSPPSLIKAKRCIKAIGMDIKPNSPISFSSNNILSIAPQDERLFGPQMDKNEKPIYIIGGGKTAMDTALALITRYPHLSVSLIVGKGTVFFKRDKAFPRGLKRWWGGTPMLDAFVDLALKFDGDNELEVLDHFKKEYAVCLDERFERYMFGTISLAENERICKGLNELFIEYVADIIDTNGQTTLQFRSGESRAIENGSWIINCTGYLQPTDRTYEPYLSTHGTVVSVQATSAIQILTSMSAYYLVHMFFLDQLEELPLYELDYNALMKKNKTLLPFAGISHTLYNLLVMIDAVPAQVMSKISSECGLDFNRWYPRHRMIISAIKLMSNGHKKSQRLKKALDRLQVKHGINCGLLERH